MAEDIKKMPVGAGLPEMPEEIFIAPKKVAIDWKRILFILLGLALNLKGLLPSPENERRLKGIKQCEKG